MWMHSPGPPSAILPKSAALPAVQFPLTAPNNLFRSPPPPLLEWLSIFFQDGSSTSCPSDTLVCGEGVLRVIDKNSLSKLIQDMSVPLLFCTPHITIKSIHCRFLFVNKMDQRALQIHELYQTAQEGERDIPYRNEHTSSQGETPYVSR